MRTGKNNDFLNLVAHWITCYANKVDRTWFES